MKSPNKPHSRRLLLAAFAALPIALSPCLSAQTFLYWDGTVAPGLKGISALGAAASWSTASDAATPEPSTSPTINEVAVFNISTLTTNQSVAINGARSYGGILVTSSGSVTLYAHSTSTTSNALTLGASGITLNSGAGAFTSVSAGDTGFLSYRLVNDQSWTNDSSNAMTISGTVANSVNDSLRVLTLAGSGTGGITFNNPINDAITGGNGTLSLIVNRPGTGTTTLSASSVYSGGTTLTNGTLRAANNSSFGTGVLALNGGRLSSNSNTARAFSNAVNIGGNVTLGHSADNGELTFSTTVDLSGATRTVTTESNVVFGGIVSNGALTKEGEGTLTLNGANSFTGNLVVNAGTVALGSTSSLSSGSIQIAQGAILNTISLTGGFTIASARSFGGDGTLVGDLTFASGSNFIFNSAASLDVNGNISFGDFSVSNLLGLDSSAAVNRYVLLNSIGGSISQSGISNVGLGAAASLGGGKIAYFDFIDGDLAVNVSAIPEPGAFALLGGLASLGLAATRRRRRAV